jgi:hypothetical protein
VSRESRLLVVTIAVSGSVLLLLAQFRFPEAPPSLPTAAPLERLASRASFEELATQVARLEASIAPSLMVLRLAGESSPPSVRLSDLLATPDDAVAEPVRHVPALRIDATTALAVVPPSATVAGIVGSTEPPGTAGIVAVDPVRGLARVRVPERPARALAQRAVADLATPVYIVAVEGTQAGVTLRPVFLGRSDRFQSPRWSQSLLPLGGIVVTPGALFFTLGGEFLGTAVLERGSPALASGTEALQVVATLRQTRLPPADPGLALQPLTAGVAAAVGADKGVLVAEVLDGMPAADVLVPGDVIVDIDGQPAGTPEDVLLLLSTRLQAGDVNVAVQRGGTTVTATLRLTDLADSRPEDVTLQDVPRTGARVRAVANGSAAAQAGLMEGDLIVRAGTIDAPSSEQIAMLLESTAAVLPLVVQRADRRRLILLQPRHAGER